MRCTSTNKRTQEAAATFPDRLREKHGGNILIVGNPVFKGVRHPIKVKCKTCTHMWSPRAHSLISNGHGCPKCANQANTASAGKKRSPRATQAEKNKALELHAQGLSERKIVTLLSDIYGYKRSQETVGCWINPKRREANAQLRNQWIADNKERHTISVKQYLQTPHGKAKCSSNKAQKRVRWWERLDDGTIVYGEEPPLVGKELELVEAFYLERNRLIAETGIEHHVDHIRPIAVGGTHHDFNLQVLPGPDNIAKGRAFDGDTLKLYAERLKPLFDNPTHN